MTPTERLAVPPALTVVDEGWNWKIGATAVAQIDKLVRVDWDVVNAKRAEWTQRWNRQIER